MTEKLVSEKAPGGRTNVHRFLNHGHLSFTGEGNSKTRVGGEILVVCTLTILGEGGAQWKENSPGRVKNLEEKKGGRGDRETRT